MAKGVRPISLGQPRLLALDCKEKQPQEAKSWARLSPVRLQWSYETALQRQHGVPESGKPRDQMCERHCRKLNLQTGDPGGRHALVDPPRLECCRFAWKETKGPLAARA